MFHNDAMQWAVIGVGLNVNTPREALPDELAGIASSLYAETGRPFSITAILRNILEELEQRIG
jgi:BirA family biotin operon repressor/biotin-[acetyl-CoA-carboxylase] ligase